MLGSRGFQLRGDYSLHSPRFAHPDLHALPASHEERKVTVATVGSVVGVVLTSALSLGVTAVLVAGAAGVSQRVAPAPLAVTTSDSTATSSDSCIDVRTGTRFEFHARHLLSTGAIDSSWTPGASQLCLPSLEGLQGNVVADGTGGAYVGWVDDRGIDPDIYLRRLTGTGETASGWPADGLPVCRAPYSQYQLDIAGDGSGGTFLAWQDYRAGGVGQVYVQHLSALGEVVSGWPQEGRAVTDTVLEQSAPRLAPDGSGGVYVVWQGRRGRLLGCYAKRLTSSGAAAAGWPDNGVLITESSGENRSPVIAADSLGRALVVWQHVDTLGAQSLAALRIDPETNPEVGWTPNLLSLTESASDLSEPAVARAGSSAMLVAWGEWRGGASGVRVQRVVLDGLSAEWPAGGLAICDGPIGQDTPRVLTDAQGGYVAWVDFRGGRDSDVFVQRFTSVGATGSGWPANGVAVAAGARDQFAPSLASDGAGGAIITWTDPPMNASAGYVSLMKMFQHGVPRLVEAVARPSQVRIVWQLASTFRESLEVERRAEPGDWQILMRVAANDSGRVVVVDRTALQGSRVEYRLGIAIEGARMFFEPVVLEIPRVPVTLTLHRAWIDASRNLVVIAFALPPGATPSVELIDVTGRRIERQMLDGLDPGEHEATLRVHTRLPSGVYFVRLTQAGQARVAKTALLR